METKACWVWVFVMALAGVAVAGTPVDVTLLDGRRLVGDLVAIGEDGVQLIQDGKSTTTALDDVARLDFRTPPAGSYLERDLVLQLVDGGWLDAEAIDTADEALIVRTTIAERLVVPFAQLAALRRRANDAPAAQKLYEEALANRLPGKDLLITADAQPQVIRGTLTAWGPVHGEFVFNGRPRAFEIGKTYGVVLAAGAASGSEANAVAVICGTGEQFAATGVVLADDVARFPTTLGATVELKVERLASLVWKSGRTVYLSDLEPTAYAYSGVVHDHWPYRRDRNAANGPLALGGRQFPKGLGMHAESALTYDLGGAFETFAATIGIDDQACVFGTVEFHVLADGAAVFSSGPVKQSDGPREIRVPVAGVEVLTLKASLAANADVGDWADWASARVIKPKATGTGGLGN